MRGDLIRRADTVRRIKQVTVSADNGEPSQCRCMLPAGLKRLLIHSTNNFNQCPSTTPYIELIK